MYHTTWSYMYSSKVPQLLNIYTTVDHTAVHENHMFMYDMYRNRYAACHKRRPPNRLVKHVSLRGARLLFLYTVDYVAETQGDVYTSHFVAIGNLF